MSRTEVVILGVALLGGLAAAPCGAGVESLQAHVEYLASPDMQGRLVGSDHEKLAAGYIAAQLESAGARPLVGFDGLTHEFEFTAGTLDTGSSFALLDSEGKTSREWNGEDRVRALSFSDSGSVEGPLVFAGYGLVVPEGQDYSYDSYAGLDVEGKVVLVLRYFPEDADQETRSELARFSGLRHKALAARERGARALLVLTGPRSPGAGETIKMSFDASLSGSGILAGSLGGKVGRALFRRAGKNIEQVQKSLDSANPHVTGFDMPDLEVRVDIQIRREKRQGANVLAYFPGTSPDRYLVLGAHFDHLGLGMHGNSLARGDEVGGVHHGADDNASGVAVLLQMASEIGSRPRKHSTVFAFWTGEELGLLGSTDFVKNPPFPLEQVAAYVNLDMVGRMKDDRLNLQGAGSSDGWGRLIEQANVPIGLDVQVQQDPYLPTDSSVFYQAGIPTISLFTGSHEDYHRPTDVASKVNYDGMHEIARFGGRFVQRIDALDAPPKFRRIELSAERSGSRDSLRAFTGTIPDYTTEADGLLLSGVIAKGPAEKAGLTGGDVIIEFGGKKITNIYDYTYALDAIKIGEPIKVVYMRDGKRSETTVVPTKRP